jgi:hypothetical protein
VVPAGTRHPRRVCETQRVSSQHFEWQETDITAGMGSDLRCSWSCPTRHPNHFPSVVAPLQAVPIPASNKSARGLSQPLQSQAAPLPIARTWLTRRNRGRAAGPCSRREARSYCERRRHRSAPFPTDERIRQAPLHMVMCHSTQIYAVAEALGNPNQSAGIVSTALAPVSRTPTHQRRGRSRLLLRVCERRPVQAVPECGPAEVPPEAAQGDPDAQETSSCNEVGLHGTPHRSSSLD